MNKNRRDRINAQRIMLESVKRYIEDILSEEQDYYDNMPENLQGSSRGMDAEDAIDSLENVIDSLDNVIDELDGLSA